MGNSMGNFADYWEDFKNMTVSQADISGILPTRR